MLVLFICHSVVGVVDVQHYQHCARPTLHHSTLERVLVSALRMHHTAVLAAIGDYRRVDTLKRAGARKKRAPVQEDAEKYRVFPFITINRNRTYEYTDAYKDALSWAEIKLCPEII